MRNLIEFPITLDEVIDCLQQLKARELERTHTELSCGDMTPILLHRAIQILRREKFLHGG